MARAVTKEKKLAVLELIKEKKNILFGSFANNAVEKNTKIEAWTEILKKSQSLGLVNANRDWNYARDHIFGLWKSRALAKRDNSRKTGTGGGKSAVLDDVDNTILDIIGNDAPVVEGLGLPEADGISPCNTSEIIKTNTTPTKNKHLKRKADGTESVETLKQNLIKTEIYKNKLKFLNLKKN